MSLQNTDGFVYDTSGNLPVSLSLFNGSTFDKQLNNTQGILLASAARTASTGSANQTNYNARGVHVCLDITAASGTGGLMVRVQGIDLISGNFYSLNGSPTGIIATGTYDYEFYPGSTQGSVAGSNNVNGRYQTALPRIWKAQINVGDSSSYTYSLSYALIL